MKKMAAFANKIKRGIQGNNKTVKKGLHGPMIIDGGEGKKFKNVVLLRQVGASQGGV